MYRTSRLTLVVAAAAVAVLASACSDTSHLTSPAAAKPSFAAAAAGPWQVRERTIPRNGHAYAIVAANDGQSGKPPVTFYVFKDGAIQSITSVVYKRVNGASVPFRARTTVFVSGKPAQQSTLDATVLASTVDPILAQEDLSSAAAGGGSVAQSSATLQSSLISYSADYTTWDTGGDFADEINAFIASAGSEYCSDTFCIYIES